MEFVFFLIIYVVCGVIAAAIASSKGRSVAGWFFGGFFLSWIGIIIVAVLPNLKEQQARVQMADAERRRLREQLRQERLKNEAFRQYSLNRLDVHDQVLGVDTRSSAALPGSAVQAALPGQSDDPLSQLARAQSAPPAPGSPRDVQSQALAAMSGQTPRNDYRQWYYEWGGKSLGPVNERDLRQMIREGQITSRTLLWSEGMTDWSPASQVTEFDDEVLS